MALKNGARWNIFHGNSDRITLGLWHCVCVESGCSVENNFEKNISEFRKQIIGKGIKKFLSKAETQVKYYSLQRNSFVTGSYFEIEKEGK